MGHSQDDTQSDNYLNEGDSIEYDKYTISVKKTYIDNFIEMFPVTFPVDNILFNCDENYIISTGYRRKKVLEMVTHTKM